MRKKIKQQSQYTKKDFSGTTLKQSQPLPITTQLPNIYRSINNLPLHKFIDCIVNHNLSTLIISGFPSEFELTESWSSIVQQYTDAMGNQEHRLYTNLTKEIAVNTIVYNLINRSVSILRKQYHQQLCKELNKLLSTSFKFDFQDQERYNKELDRCINRSKSLKINIDLLQIKVAELEKKFNGKSQTPTIEYYQTTLITLSDYAKYQISDSITVFEFCERIKRLNNYYDQMKQQNKKR